MGDVVLGELLRGKGLASEPPARIEAYVVAVGAEMAGAARQVLARLRRQGVKADASYAPAKLAKALRAADAAGAGRAILVGPEEWSEGAVRVKDLASGSERTVPVVTPMVLK